MCLDGLVETRDRPVAIGDLTGEPQDIVVKLFSSDAKLLEQTAPRIADAIEKVGKDKSGKQHIVDIKNGVENTISGPATQFNVNPTVAAKAGFTPEEVATDAEAWVRASSGEMRPSVQTSRSNRS